VCSASAELGYVAIAPLSLRHALMAIQLYVGIVPFEGICGLRSIAVAV
jgi:hypothetical protein